MDRRQQAFKEGVRMRSYAKSIGIDELAASLRMSPATLYRKLADIDTLTVGQLRGLLRKLGYQRTNSEDVAAVEAFIWAYNTK